MTTGFDHGGRTVSPLYASGHGNRTPSNGAAGAGRATKMGGANGQEGPRSGAVSDTPKGQYQVSYAGDRNTKGMGHGASRRGPSPVGDHYPRGYSGHDQSSARSRTASVARAGLMVGVGALVVMAALRQHEVWEAHHPKIMADVVPGVSESDPFLTFKIGQR